MKRLIWAYVMWLLIWAMSTLSVYCIAYPDYTLKNCVMVGAGYFLIFTAIFTLIGSIIYVITEN